MIVEDEELFDEEPDRGFDLTAVPLAAREPIEFDQLLMKMARIETQMHTRPCGAI